MSDIGQGVKTSNISLQPYRMINTNQILNRDNVNPILKFCAFLSERAEFESIVIYQPDDGSNLPEDALNKSLPLIPDAGYLINDPDNSLWNDLKKLSDSSPYVVIFICMPNVNNLDFKKKFEKQEKINNLFLDHGIVIDQMGWSYQVYGASGYLVVLSNTAHSLPQPPEDFKITALLAVRNEEDIIRQTLEYLSEQGVDVYILDNWSTDNSEQIFTQFLGKGVIGIEKWPKDAPPEYFDLQSLLRRKEELSQELDSDWFMHYDTDELRESPWQNLTLRNAFWIVDQMGYNSIDFTLLNFRPIDEGYSKEDSLLEYFSYCEFGDRPGHFRQVKAWKKQPVAVDLHSVAGHKVQFSGQKIFPYKFLTRHYPFRSQSQANKKITKDRINRLDPEALKRGWHSHYKHININEDIIKEKEDLLQFNDQFYTDYLIERLTGIGIRSEKTFQVDRFLTQDYHNTIQTRDLSGRNANLSKYINELEQEILFYSMSKSWRLTRPLRKIIQFLKKR